MVMVLGLLEIMCVFSLSFSLSLSLSLAGGRYAMFNGRRELRDNSDADAIQTSRGTQPDSISILLQIIFEEHAFIVASIFTDAN